MKGLILFDVDGTLVKRSIVHRDSFLVAIKKVLGLNIDFNIDCTGMIDKQIIKELLKRNNYNYFTENDIRIIINEMQKYYEKNYKKDPVQLLLGVKDLLHGLREKGYCLGLLTGNIEKIAYLKISLVGIDEFFEVGSFGNEANDRIDLVKIAIEKAKNKFGIKFKNEEIFVVGDTINDERTAKENYVNSIAVGTGNYNYNILGIMNPDLYFKDFSDYKDVINKIENLSADKNKLKRMLLENE
jgi:phosphoglycolate phosphatase